MKSSKKRSFGRFFGKKERDEDPRSYYSNTIVILFFLIISTPFLYWLNPFSSEKRDVIISENRKSVPLPIFRLKSVFPFTQKYEKYFSDNFFLREKIISSYNRFKFNLFGTSSVESVIIGKRGWLFLSKENGRDLLKFYISSKHPVKKDIEIISGYLGERRKWAESLGCVYLYVIVPDKWTVYPEMMPEGIDNASGKTFIDRILTGMKKRDRRTILYLKDVFLRIKKRREIYQSGDTHWNQFGSYIAYKYIIRAIRKPTGIKIFPEKFGHFSIIKERLTSGDLIRMINLPSANFRNSSIMMKRKKHFEISTVKNKIDGFNQKIVAEVGFNRGLTSMFLIHDSFGEYLKKFFPYNFHKLFYTQERNYHLFSTFIKENRIKVIIEEIAERSFLQKFIN